MQTKAGAKSRPDHNEISAHYNQALRLIRLGQYESAIGELRLVVRAEPGALEPEYYLAILLEREHALGEAAEHLNAAHMANPSDTRVLQHLVSDLLALGKKEAAQSVLNQLLASGSLATKQQAGEALLEAGDYRQAALLLENARSHSQPNLELDILLARAEIGAQDDFKAIDLLKPHEATDRTGETAYWLGVAYWSAGATEEARSAFSEAAKLNPHNGRAFYHLGAIEATEPDQVPRAVIDLEEALRLEPENASYGLTLGKLLLQQDQAKEAVESLNHVRGNELENGERDLLIGIAQISLTGPGSAISTLLHAAAENPSLALTYNMLGFCYFDTGNMIKASAAYRKASDLSPETRIFAHGAAVALDRMNDISQALVYATRAVELPSAGAEDHLLVGKLLAREGKNSAAISELLKAVEQDPELEAAYYLLAHSYQRVGYTKQAAECIAKLKELKRQHEQEYAEATKGARSIASSTLLQGAPTVSVGTEGP
jgi:tetratricopeptide (TPR) repeat protein